MRGRIAGLTALAAVLAICLFGIPLALGVARYYLIDERGKLERVADEATITVSADLLGGHDPVELPAHASGIALGLYGPSGHKISGSGPALADSAVRGALSGHVSHGDTRTDLVVAVPAASNERVTAVIRSATPRARVYRRTAQTWLLMAGLGAVAIGLTWLVARRQARRLTRPLEDMTATAQRLGDGDFSARTLASGIPEIDSAGSSLNATAERLGTLLDRERAFSADASHQLRTPLTGLRLSLEAARDTPGADPHAAMTTAIAAADRLERTIDELLALARDTPRRTTPLDVVGLRAEIRQTWHAGLAAQGRPLRLQVGSDAPPSTASTPATRQILNVLLDNAVRHGEGAVTVTIRDAAGALAIEVTDEGPGMAGSGLDGDEGELFARRTSPGDEHGIGLAMARSLAEAEGGRLLLTRSRPPTFTLLLPVAPAPEIDT